MLHCRHLGFEDRTPERCDPFLPHLSVVDVVLANTTAAHSKYLHGSMDMLRHCLLLGLWPGVRSTRNATARGTRPVEKMSPSRKPRMYRSIEGCCICRAKSSSCRFTDSKRHEKDFRGCFGLREIRSGDICNACVQILKKWRKLPEGSNRNWNHVVDARAGLKTTFEPRRIETPSGNRIKSRRMAKLRKGRHSTTSAQSTRYSNPSGDGADSEMASGCERTPAFSFIDPTYWKRQKICCGIIYEGRFGEVLIDTHLFKPCSGNKKAAAETPEEQGPEALPVSTQE
ncbi:SIN3-HDAC complex-associated factor-like [Nycticebus coucang]|uniref:SIN3-HDAC complex-associated factor-like n=1 Tax=Nycticebus coucang TaxID=9470 RepID=UPI00234C862F|nr:SIN3-HDAC complex-associated factor-like [Nycticebus coucang]